MLLDITKFMEEIKPEESKSPEEMIDQLETEVDRIETGEISEDESADGKLRIKQQIYDRTKKLVAEMDISEPDIQDLFKKVTDNSDDIILTPEEMQIKETYLHYITTIEMKKTYEIVYDITNDVIDEDNKTVPTGYLLKYATCVTQSSKTMAEMFSSIFDNFNMAYLEKALEKKKEIDEKRWRKVKLKNPHKFASKKESK